MSANAQKLRWWKRENDSAGIDCIGHGSAYTQLEELFEWGHRNPFRAPRFSEYDPYPAAGDRPGHGLFKAVAGHALLGRSTAPVLDPRLKHWPISNPELAP
jgi:hypothetical protein